MYVQYGFLYLIVTKYKFTVHIRGGGGGVLYFASDWLQRQRNLLHLCYMVALVRDFPLCT